MFFDVDQVLLIKRGEFQQAHVRIHFGMTNQNGFLYLKKDSSDVEGGIRFILHLP